MPFDALHVRHPGIVIEARVVVLVLLDDGEHARRRLASRGAGRHRRAQDRSVGVVESDLLAPDRHDRHDRLACLARRRRLGGWRGARRSRRGVGGRRRQFMLSVRASVFLLERLGIAPPPRPVAGPKWIGLCGSDWDQANSKCCAEERADGYRIEANVEKCTHDTAHATEK